jgi:hypothetical protein
MLQGAMAVRLSFIDAAEEIDRDNTVLSQMSGIPKEDLMPKDTHRLAWP